MRKSLIFSLIFTVLLLTSCRECSHSDDDASTVASRSSAPLCSCHKDKTATPQCPELTAEMAFEAVNNYCHQAYDWSPAADNPSLMGVSMGEETDSTYQVVFRSYTGALVTFHISKASGTARMVESVPALNVESEAGILNVFDYLTKE